MVITIRDAKLTEEATITAVICIPPPSKVLIKPAHVMKLGHCKV